MLNKGYLTVLCLILVLGVVGISGCTSSGSSQTTAPENAITGIYNNSGVYFTVPDGWKAYNGNNNYVGKAFGDNVKVFIYQYNDTYDSAKELADEQVAHFKYWGTNPTVTPVTINGIKGYAVFGFDKVEEQYEKHYIVKKGSYYYDLDFICDSLSESTANNALNSPQVNTLVNSFNA